MKDQRTKLLLYIYASWFVMLVTVLFFITACNNSAREKREKDLEEFKAYVQAHKDSADFYADRKWDELDAEYEEKRAKLEKDTAEMGEEMRADYYRTVNDWEEYKNDFNRRQEERAKVAEMDVIRSQLTITGVRTDYTDLSPTDIVRQYEHFVNTVRANKDTYSKEQWLVVNVSWKSLNGRKKEINKDISSADNTTIARLQRDYTAIKAANRPFAESEES